MVGGEIEMPKTQKWTSAEYMAYLDKNKSPGVDDYDHHAETLKKRGIVGARGAPLAGRSLRVAHSRWMSAQAVREEVKREVLGPGARLEEINNILNLSILSPEQKVEMAQQVITRFFQSQK